MELTDRKKQILKIVVDSYINTAEPVGSKAIVEQMPGTFLHKYIFGIVVAHLSVSSCRVSLEYFLLI